MVPEAVPWNYTFMGVKHSTGMKVHYKLDNPKEFYHPGHRPTHFLGFVGAEQGALAEADVDDNFA